MSSMPKIICTVRALHSFQSPEQSSLNFEKGDYIDVLAQLDSGWWDGWCNGARGWFPSNYVEIVSVEESEVRVPQKTRKGSMDTANEEHFYYSQLANDVHFRAPANADSDVEEYDTGIRIRNGSIEDSDEERDKFEPDPEPRRPRNVRKDSAKRFSMDSQPSVIPEMDELSENLDLDANQLMAQWVERKTPQGRVYYCNLITQETTWDKDAIDPATGRLRRKEDDEDSSDEQTVSKGANSFRDDTSNIITFQSISSSGTNKSEPLTWQKLSADVAVAIHRLNNTAQQNIRSMFTQHTGLVVETIRMMLYAAGLMEKDSYHTQDATLRGPHRAVMASLSKLVLSARMASEAPSTCAPSLSSELIFKLQKDAGDVLAAVRDFVTACQQRQIRVEHMTPRFVRDDDLPVPGDEAEDDNRQKAARSKYPLNQDLVVSLQTHINQIYGSTDALAAVCTHAVEVQHEENLNGTAHTDQEKARTNVVTLFSTLSAQLSQFLTIIQGIDLDNMDNIQVPSLDAFKAEKQALYDAFGKLLGAVQTHSDPKNPIAYSASLIDDTVAELEQSLGCMFTCVVEMVEQRRQWLLRRGYNEITGEAEETYAADDTVSITNTIQTLALPQARVRGHRRQASPMSESSTGKPDQQRQRQASTRPDETPWYLGHEHQDEDEIAFTSDGGVKAGTLPALVERLTLHDTLDTSFIANFLLTYRSFCTTEEFVSLLEKRYTITAPEGLTPEELEIWKERKQKLIRLRVFNVMKNWLESYYNDEDKMILDRLEFFTNTVIRDASSFAADQLIRLISMRKETDAEDGLKKLVPNSAAGPVPIIPKNLTTTRINLLDTDPLELARQLSIVDFKLYSSIRPIECLSKAWSRDDADLAVHVKQSINYCNQLTSWVTGSILEHDEARRRVVVIKHWALVADRCRSLNNFNTCMAILSAFDNSAVGRLRRTWEMVGKGTNQILNHIRKLMGANRNFTEYREMIHSINPPCIPFLGIYLQDLTFIEDGNPDILPKSNNLINFAKRQKTAEVIREIKQFQSVPYTLQVVPLLQHFIKTQLEASLDVETLYERSLEIEPRTTPAAAEAAKLLEMIN